MSYHPLNNNYMVGNIMKMNDQLLGVTGNSHLESYRRGGHGNLLQLPVENFQQRSRFKSFFNHDKQPSKEARVADPQWANKSTGRTIKASTLTQQRNNLIQNNLTLQENLTKTVKHTNSSYKKAQIINNELSLNNKSQYQPKRQQPLSNYHHHQYNTSPSYYIQQNSILSKQPIKNTVVMSIQQIRQLQRRQLDNKAIVHRITSSSSRQKLKTSSSKDSKGDTNNNVEKRIGNLNVENTQRYSKYINDGLMMCVNIDLRKQMMQNVATPTNPNNVGRKYGQLSSENRFKQLYAGHQRVMSDLGKFSSFGNERDNHYGVVDMIHNKSNQISNQRTVEKDEPLTCRQSIPREDQHISMSRFKSRSKSNLSKYTQMKSTLEKQALSTLNLCHNQSLQKSSELPKFQTPIRLELSMKSDALLSNQKNNERKIHVLSYSAAKNKVQENFEQNKKQGQIRETEYKKGSSSGISISQSKKGSQTERKALQRDQHFTPRKDDPAHIALIMEQKLRKKPIRLTMQKKN